MSEPMRFSLKHHGQLSCVEHCPEGEYVLHSDYARLKADLDYVRKMRTQETLDLQEMSDLNNAMRAEITRLRKAGDAMDYAISEIDPQRAERHRFMKMTDAEYIAVTKWRTAKDPNYNRA